MEILKQLLKFYAESGKISAVMFYNEYRKFKTNFGNKGYRLGI